jgi:hypothetical protein
MLQGDALQTAIRDNNLVDLHLIDSTTVSQTNMIQRLEEHCKYKGYMKPPMFPCERNTDYKNNNTITEHSSQTCCPQKCDAYTGQLKELCQDKTKLQNFLDNLPKIKSMGSGYCQPTNRTPTTLKHCKKNDDIPCRSRTKTQCTTYNHPTNTYKCGWHEHNPNLDDDTFPTGCYNLDDCIVHTKEQCVKDAHRCQWTKQNVCVDAGYCPFSCSTLTANACHDNPFCVYHEQSKKCQQKGVIDQTMYKQQYEKSKPKQVFNKVFHNNQTYNVHMKQLIDVWNQEKHTQNTK